MADLLKLLHNSIDGELIVYIFNFNALCKFMCHLQHKMSSFNYVDVKIKCILKRKRRKIKERRRKLLIKKSKRQV